MHAGEPVNPAKYNCHDVLPVCQFNHYCLCYVILVLIQITFAYFVVAGQIPIVQLNFAALSNETPFNRDTVESCVKEVLQALSRSVQAKRNVEFHFAGIGRLSIRESKVKMKFYKEFLRSMDGSGNLVHALSNVSTVLEGNTHARLINVC